MTINNNSNIQESLRFENLTLFEKNNNTNYSITLNPIKVILNESYYFIIPRGFITDCASIPIILRNIFFYPYDKEILMAGIIHDYFFMQTKNKFLDDYHYNDYKKTLFIRLYNISDNQPSKYLYLTHNTSNYIYYLVYNIYKSKNTGYLRNFIDNLKGIFMYYGLNIGAYLYWINRNKNYIFDNNLVEKYVNNNKTFDKNLTQVINLNDDLLNDYIISNNY